MGIKEIPVRKEVFKGVDPAPKLGKILDVIFESEEPGDLNTKLLADPLEFFRRTFITDNMLELFEKVVEAFEGKQNKVFALYSFFGGGKTHTLLAIIHAFRDPGVFTHPEITKHLDPEKIAKLEELSERIKRVSGEIIPFAGDSSKYSGSPLQPVNVGGYAFRTVWGYLAHSLGRYHEFSRYDESISAPQEDVIEGMIIDSRALFVFDELFDYLVNLSAGEYAKYANAVISFIELFIQAIKPSRSVTIITLPVDVKGRMDPRYEAKEIGDRTVRSIWDTLKGKAVLIEPLRSGEADIVNVLRKRLFEEIPASLKDKAIQKYKEKVENYLNYFGSREYVREVEKTYPFSPEYVRLLEELVLRTGMQKTRDALVISMKALREIHNSNQSPELIMPWHVNLGWDVLSKAFLGGLDNYKPIYVRQVENFPDSSAYGELPRYILRVIFLATYHYDSPIPQEQFPDKINVVRMVYEPTNFSVKNLEIPDIENALNDILSSPEITHLNIKDGRFWFWRQPNIKELIQKKAERIYRDKDPRIYEKIEEFLKTGLETSLERFAQGLKTTKRVKKQAQLEHYFEDYSIIKDFENYPEDSQRIKLAVLLRPELVSEVKNIFEYVEEDKPRSYRNTLAVLSPVPSKHSELRAYEELMRRAAGLLATQEVLEEIKIHYGDYGEEAIEVQRAIVENERRSYTQGLAANIPRVFSHVFFRPINADETAVEKIVDPGYNLAFNVHNTLVHYQKIVEEMNFEYLNLLIRTELGVDLETDERMRTVDQIVKWFLQNQRFPMTKEKVVKETIKRGVRSLKIGLYRKSGNEAKVFLKPVHETIPPAMDSEGVVPQEIRSDDGVLSKIRAIREQFNILKESEMERTLITQVERIYYVLYPELGGEFYTFEQLEVQPNWEEIFLSGVIVRKVEKIEYDLLVNVYPANTVFVEEGGTANFTILARPINLEIDSIRITIKQKKGEESKAVIEDEEMVREETEKGIAYKYEFSREPADKREEFIAELITSGKMEIEKTAPIVVGIKEKERTFTTDVVSDEHIGYKLLEIREIEDLDVLEEIRNSIIPLGKDKVGGRVIGKIKASYGGGEMELELRKMETETGIEVAIETAAYGEEREIIQKFRIEFINTVLEELLVRKLEELNKKVKFTLRSGDSSERDR